MSTSENGTPKDPTEIFPTFGVKPELEEEWKIAVGKNCMNGYSFGVVLATIASFEVLDAGGTAEDAIKIWTTKKLDITGFMAGCAAQWIGHYHRRGDEFRMAWNDRYGVTEERAKGGTVNPAIMTMGNG